MKVKRLMVFRDAVKGFVSETRKRLKETLPEIYSRSQMVFREMLRKTRTKILREKWAGYVTAGVLGVVFLSVFILRNETPLVQGAVPTYTVKSERFELKIVERGTLNALRNILISSVISGNRGKIIQLAPEGTLVKKGDELVLFDKSDFINDLQTYEAELEKLKAEVIQTEEDVKAEKARNEQKIRAAQDEIVLAELVLKDLSEGSGPLKVKKSEFEVEKLRSEYEKLKGDFEEFRELVKEGYVSQVELDGVKRKLEETEKAFEFSKLEHENFVEYDYPTQLETARSRVRSAKENLDKLKETSEYVIAGKMAAINRAKGRMATTKSRLQRAEYDLENTTIYAPVDGFVVYNEISRGGESRKVGIGDSMFPTQPFMYIPDTSKMLVNTQIREVDIYKVKAGQEAVVRVDAYPDLLLTGRVSMIGTLAELKDGEAGGKYFNLQIELLDVDTRLRPGMTTRVEILVDEEEDVLLIPLQAVFDRSGSKMVYLSIDGKVEARQIQMDKSNDDYTVVRSGLQAGDKLLLLDPASETDSFRQMVKTPSTDSRENQ
ncbi:MAG TPA: efflux RND transporter periplasmic adaptor subunit [Nitrospiria bacterium]